MQVRTYNESLVPYTPSLFNGSWSKGNTAVGGNRGEVYPQAPPTVVGSGLITQLP